MPGKSEGKRKGKRSQRRKAPKRPGKASSDRIVPSSAPAAQEADVDQQATKSIEQADLPPFIIAGIGASAGGIEACSQLLQALPHEAGVALVIVQHLAPGHDSILAELLASNTSVPVVQVTDGMPIQPDHVYVIPPNCYMDIVDGHLHLRPRPMDRVQHMPIDHFLRSLAEYAQTRAVGIILSGTGSDGALGMREIKAAGGITMVQEPRTARSDGMPRAALVIGAVDLTLAPDQITEELVRIASHPLVAAPPMLPTRPADPDIPDDYLGRIFAMLRKTSGVDFSQYKQPTIKRRLQRRMVLHKITSFAQYVEHLEQNPDEVRALYQDILIHVTRFFRDPESFDALSASAFPAIVDNRAGDAPIRIWVPGCSTGEEAYSVAIALQEFLGDRAMSTSIQIFATDISEVAIEHARAGVYPESIAADVSPERLRRFFIKVDSTLKVAKNIRDMCVFARQDLTRDPPFSKLDLIICRNVLIYLGPSFQRRLMNVFHYALKPTCFLMLGSAETVGSAADLFSTVDKRYRLYTKKMVSEPADLAFTTPGMARLHAEGTRKPLIEPHATSIQNEANHIVLARYSPPGVLVNDDLQIIQFRGQTGRFLEPASGDPSLNVLKMAREGLMYSLRTAIHEARKTGKSVRREGVRVRANGESLDACIEVIPMDATGGRHFLILFEEAVKPRAEKDSAAGKKGGKQGESRRIRELEYELAASREYLQSIIQDLEAANEELQSANEEILSANEELQSTNEELDTAKEELQSTNEELNTLNEELQGRNEELNRVNSDLVNLLASVQIAIVMVGSDLRIRRFTPMAEKTLNLIPSDVGRPIGDIKPNIDCPDLVDLIAHSIDTVTMKERDVRDRSGHRYSLRIRPYKSIENRIEGAVVALFDSQKATDHEQQTQADR